MDVIFLKFTPSHFAFTMIGSANAALGLIKKEDSTELNTKLKTWAMERLQFIPIKCSEINLDPIPLFNALTQIDNNALRKFLKKTFITILLVLSDPRDQAKLRLLEEMRTLGETLRSTTLGESFKIEGVPSCRVQDLMPALLRYKPDILHFSGHGDLGGLYFETDNGKSQYVDPELLANLLSLAHKDGLKGMIMNACYSEDQAKAIANAVGHVIAMEGKLSDKGAIAFTRSFYGALGEGKTFEDSFTWGMAGAAFMTSKDAVKPRLLKSQAN